MDAPAAAPPAVQLRTPQTADTSGGEKAVRTTIDSARQLLAGVDFGQLNNERKKAYNDAKLLMQQAEDALKQGNLVFAQGVANKAETLAKRVSWCGRHFVQIGHMEEPYGQMSISCA